MRRRETDSPAAAHTATPRPSGDWTGSWDVSFSFIWVSFQELLPFSSSGLTLGYWNSQEYTAIPYTLLCCTEILMVNDKHLRRGARVFRIVRKIPTKPLLWEFNRNKTAGLLISFLQLLCCHLVARVENDMQTGLPHLHFKSLSAALRVVLNNHSNCTHKIWKDLNLIFTVIILFSFSLILLLLK